MNSPRQITLKDIAHACGVSRATVSLVVRGSPLVHANTRRRVEAEIRRQGYVYNRTAANLRQRVSTTVALIIHDLSNPFLAEFTLGADEALGAKGYGTLLGNSNESPARQYRVLESLMEYRPGGIILSPAETGDMADIERIIGPQTPLLVFNRMLGSPVSSGVDYDYLCLDNRSGMREATKYLLSLGHRRIAFYGGSADSSSCRERRLGYQDAMVSAGITPRGQWMFDLAPTRIAANADAGTLFRQRPAPTAAVCYNDVVALGLMQGLARLGRCPGVDFAVTGFDNIPEAAFCIPSLTTMNADPRVLGRQAAELLLQRIADPALPHRSVSVPVQLIKRESATCLKGIAHK